MKKRKPRRNQLIVFTLEECLHCCLHSEDTGKHIEKSLRNNSKSVLFCETKKKNQNPSIFFLQERMPIVHLIVTSYMVQITLLKQCREGKSQSSWKSNVIRFRSGIRHITASKQFCTRTFTIYL